MSRRAPSVGGLCPQVAVEVVPFAGVEVDAEPIDRTGLGLGMET